jgi:Fe-S-cluster containining protein
MNHNPVWVGFSEGEIDHTACAKQANAMAEPPKPKSVSQSLRLFQHDYDENIVPDCGNCKDNCCSAPHVATLSAADQSRLTEAGFAWSIAPVRAHSDDLYPSLKQIDGRCAFLTHDNRCSIYRIRPLVCRAFPLQVAEGGERIRFASTCASRRTSSDGDHEALNQMAASAIRSFSQKKQDRVENEKRLILEPAPGRSFSDVLREKTTL